MFRILRNKINTMLKLFLIRSEERFMSLIVLLVLTALNSLTIIRYYDQFSKLCDNYGNLFIKTFHVSGFDPLTYVVVSNWHTSYNVYRHPLLAFFMYPANQLNQGLMQLTGMNWVQFIVAAILIFCSIYSFLFLYRIQREVIRIGRFDACLLTSMLFSFAYVMVSAIVPDHFIMSMMMLLLTLYVSGVRQKEGRQLSIVDTVVLFFITAGISLNNGIKTFLAAFFTNEKRFFHWRYLLLAVILPCALIWGGARIE